MPCPPHSATARRGLRTRTRTNQPRCTYSKVARGHLATLRWKRSRSVAAQRRRSYRKGGDKLRKTAPRERGDEEGKGLNDAGTSP